MKSKARLKLDKDKNFIIWLFDGRCVKCGRPTVIIHEIEPISHGPKTLVIKNRVLICGDCHDWSHSIGTKKSIPILRELRKKFLIRRFLS